MITRKRKMNPKVEARVDFGHGKMRMDTDCDRLSSLPDDIIHNILSKLNIKDAIGTGALSSRWRFIWTSMPHLSFSTEDFITLPKFSKFVTNVFSRRNNLTELYSMKLRFRVKTSHLFVKRILDHANSNNIQQLNVVYLIESHTELPLSLFSSQSLKHLSLRTRRDVFFPFNTRFTSTWELPTLTTLDLHKVTLRDANADKGISAFSNCPNLKSLKLNQFTTSGSRDISIFHPRLLYFTLENCFSNKTVVNVVTPQLKKLTIRSSYGNSEHYIISSPGLVSLLYKSSRWNLSTKGAHSLEKADICVSSPQDADARQIICLLQQLHSVKFLKLNLELIEVLSSSLASSVDLILPQSPFVNLKYLKIYPEEIHQASKKVAMSTKLKSYLLDGSSGSTFTMVFREEIIAQELMADLPVYLERENKSSKIKRAHLDRGKTPVESHEPEKLKIWEDMALIKSGCENPGMQHNTRVIILKLQRIKELLTMLPASKRAKLQPCFSSLCAQADIVINQVTDSMKIHCDENQSVSSVCATTLEPSS